MKYVIEALIAIYLGLGFFGQSFDPNFDPRKWLHSKVQEKIQSPKPRYSQRARSLTGQSLSWKAK